MLAPAALNPGGDGRLVALLDGVAQAVFGDDFHVDPGGGQGFDQPAGLGDNLLVLLFQNLYGPAFHLIDGAAIQVFDFFFILFDQVNQR